MDGMFSAAEIRVMRQAFDVIAKQGGETRDSLAATVMRAAQEDASDPEALICRVKLMLLKGNAK
ncbi:MAG: hypothetical protein Q8M31_05405 [Beijerinckiaceae bacterium]|nr:hypothetical protein [Beijerinckiaceae bacterium]